MKTLHKFKWPLVLFAISLICIATSVYMRKMHWPYGNEVLMGAMFLQAFAVAWGAFGLLSVLTEKKTV
jgi:hypothetical protein